MVSKARSSIGSFSYLAGAAAVIGSVLFGFGEAQAAPYQASFTLDCMSTTCRVDLPVVAANRRLNVRWVSCQITGTINSRLLTGNFRVRNNNTTFLTFFLGATTHSTNGVHILTQEMDLVISAGRRGAILLQLTEAVGDASCAIIGDAVILP